MAVKESIQFLALSGLTGVLFRHVHAYTPEEKGKNFLMVHDCLRVLQDVFQKTEVSLQRRKPNSLNICNPHMDFR